MFNFFDEIKKDLKLNLSATYTMVNIGGKAIYAEGHNGLIAINENEISFKLGKKIASVKGTKLKLKILSSSTICISGDIISCEVN